MLKIDEQSLKSSTPPNVYVRKIQVCESSMVFSKKSNSTNKINEPKAQQGNVDGSTTYRQGDITDDSEQSNEGLKVTIDLSIVGTNQNDSWIYDNKIRENLIVKVVQSANPNLTKELLVGPGSDFFDKNNRAVFDRYNEFIDYDIQEVSVLNNDKSTTLEKMNSLTKNKILSVVQKFQFYVPINTGHLTYMAVCQFNQSTKSSPLIPHSPVMVERVLDTNNVVQEAFKFVSPDGSTWASAVHFHPTKGWMEGAFHTDKTHRILNRVVTKNTKIQYEPIVDKMSQLELVINENYENYPPNYFSNLYITRNKDGQASFGFNFDHLNYMINNSKFGKLFNNSDPKVRAALLSECPILDLKITRDRVRVIRGQNRLQTPTDLIVDFSTQDEPETVINSYDVDGILKTNIKYSFDGGGGYPNSEQVHSGDEVPDGFVPSGAITEEFVLGSDGYRMFSGHDFFMSKKTDGLYQYSVELTVKDGTKGFLEKKLNELRLSNRDARDYLSKAKISNRLKESTVALNDGFISNEFNKNNYTIISENSTDVGSSIKSPTSAKNVQTWVACIVKYVEILDLLFDIGSGDKTLLSSSLYSMLSPVTATIDTIVKFVNVSEELEQKLESILVKKSIPHSEGRSSVYGSNSRQILNTNTSFKDIFDSNVAKNTGFDYLGVDAASGFPRISRKQFVSRMDEEYRRINNNKISQQKAASKYDFLSKENVASLFSDTTKGADIAPSFIYLEGEKVGLLSQKIDSLDYVTVTGIVQNILLANSAGSFFAQGLGKSSEALSDLGKGATKSRLEKIQSLQKDISDTVGLKTNKGAATGKTQVNGLSSEAFLGMNNKFSNIPAEERLFSIEIDDDSDTDANAVISRVLKALNAPSNGKNSPSSFDLNKSDNIIVKNVISPKQSKNLSTSKSEINNFIKNEIPHQQKLLTLREKRLYDDVSAMASSNDDVESDGFIYNFGLLRRVEYLSGYRNGSIKSEQWVKLTLDQLSNINGSILCRIRKNNQTQLNIGNYELFDNLPVYNEYFIITSENQQNMRQTPPLKSNYTQNTLNLYNGSQREVVEQLLNLLSLEANMRDECQYFMTETPKAPTSAFKKITGTKKTATAKNGQTRTTGPQQGTTQVRPTSTQRRAAPAGSGTTRSRGGSY